MCGSERYNFNFGLELIFTIWRVSSFRIGECQLILRGRLAKFNFYVFSYWKKSNQGCLAIYSIHLLKCTRLVHECPVKSEIRVLARSTTGSTGSRRGLEIHVIEVSAIRATISSDPNKARIELLFGPT